MFRIKTDIRQYKCESKDKVEKLIRNWVIRPSDLIYNTDEREWLPIGEHPAFVKLFGILAEAEQSMPDTVVTSENPLEYGRNGKSVPAEIGNATSDEVTQIAERPQEPSAGVNGRQDPPLEARETDVFDQEEVAAEMSKRDQETPVPPEAPEGVEPPHNDEVTVMTEKTLDLLTVEDPGDDDAPAASEPDETTTDETQKEEEVTDVRERPSGPREAVAVDAPSPDDETLEEPLSDEEDAAAPEEASHEPPRGIGRHDLPEEFFATNEISSPVVREELERMDDLAQLSEPSEPDEEKTGGWRIHLEEEDGEDGSHEKFRVTEQVEREEAKAPSEPVDPLRDTDELERQMGDETTVELDDDEKPQAAHAPAARETDGEAASASDAETQPSHEEYEVEVLDDAFDEEEDDEALFHAIPSDHVADPYAIPLPFAVGPTPEDVQLGLKRTNASTSQKDRAYPFPGPKERDVVYTRLWDFARPPAADRTFAVVVIFLAGLAGLVMLVATC